MTFGFQLVLDGNSRQIWLSRQEVGVTVETVSESESGIEFHMVLQQRGHDTYARNLKPLTLAGFLLGSLTSSGHAAQIDIAGPSGSVAFGTYVTVLPNGNIVVADPDANGVSQAAGAVHLYTHNGALISSLTGSSPNDHVGSEGIVVLANGNFVVVSTSWNNGSATNAGAVTWISGTSGLSGTVSAGNSLIGSSTGDSVGYAGVTALTNGNYVVSSIQWSNGGTSHVGASTWGNGGTGVAGNVSAGNSLIGTTADDSVGGFYNTVALSNGNYVVVSPHWTNGAATSAGAVTWGNGSTGLTGPVSAFNSLVGTTMNDAVGWNSVTALKNGNYVVSSPYWNNGAAIAAGAATWASGTTGLSGPVSATNSLVGTRASDFVSDGGYLGVIALTNGNYVVKSPDWSGQIGAATWANGTTGISGPVSVGNSLVGTSGDDRVATNGVALSNGNYVVQSSNWANGAANLAGAATWGDGTSGTTGAISPANSLVGTATNDQVGRLSVAALTNGNYVVSSPDWNNGSATQAGAATWGNGTTGISGPVSAANSLVGTTANDQISYNGIAPLTNGNYVVASSRWNNGSIASVGAATWASGTLGLSGPVSAANSLVGSLANDYVGYYQVTALIDGNYVVASFPWSNGTANAVGATTWANGTRGLSGTVSALNSLVGTSANDEVGYGVTALVDGNYVVASPLWSDGVVSNSGAITLASGRFRLSGTIDGHNSVRGTAANHGMNMAHGYDASRQQLAVGRPGDNILSLFTMDQLFADGFEM